MKDFIKFIKSLIKRYSVGGFFLTSPQVASVFVGLVTLPIVLANLTVKDYGEFQFIQALQLWMITLTASYITLGARRGIIKGLKGTFLFAFFSRLKLFAILMLLVLLGASFIYYIGFITSSILLIVMGAYLIIGYLPQISYLQFFIAKKQFKNYALWQIVTSVLASITSAYAAFTTHDILIFAYVLFGLTSLMGLAGFFYVIFKNNLYSPYKRGEIDRTCFSYGIKLIPASLISGTSNKITSFIIGPFFGFANLAVFSIALRLEERFRGPTKSLQNLLYSDFVGIEQKELVSKIKMKLMQGLLLSTVFTLICVFLGYLYIDLFLPEAYQGAKLYFLILALGLPAVILQIIMHTILEANLRHRELTALIILPSILKILIIVLLGFLLGIIGICFGVVLGYWISLAFYYFLTIKRDLALKLIVKIPLLKKLANF